MLSRWIHSCSWKPRNCLNFPNFLKQKISTGARQSPYYGPFSPSEGLQPLTIWSISICFSSLFCKLVLASFSCELIVETINVDRFSELTGSSFRILSGGVGVMWPSRAFSTIQILLAFLQMARRALGERAASPPEQYNL